MNLDNKIFFSVFIPTLNERDNIIELIEKIIKYEGLKNIIIIDDNSTDGTIEQIESLQKKYSNIIFKVRKQCRRGRGLSGIYAYKTYLELNDNSDFLLEMDADLSHNPDYIKNFIEEYSAGAKIIVGSRYADGGAETGRSILRILLSKIAHFIIRRLLSIKLKDPTAGFRAIDRNLLAKINLNNFIAEGPEIVEELYYALSLKKITIKEFPIIFPDRIKGDSKLNFLKLLKVFIRLFKIAVNDKKKYFGE